MAKKLEIKQILIFFFKYEGFIIFLLFYNNGNILISILRKIPAKI